MEKSKETQIHTSARKAELAPHPRDEATFEKPPRKCVWKRVCLFLRLHPKSKVHGQPMAKGETLWLETPSETPKASIDETDYDADDDNSILHKRHIDNLTRRCSRERCRERTERFKNRAKDLETRMKCKAREEAAKSKERRQGYRQRWRERRATIRAQLKAWEDHWEWD